MGSGAGQPAYKWLPVIDPDNCSGCGKCVEVCTPGCFELRDEVAVLVRPETCGSEEHCIEPCETGTMRMEWLEADGDRAVGVWTTAPPLRRA